MINRLGLGIRTTAHHHKLPSLLTSIRCYDRKRYLKQKKLERDSLSNEKIKLTECMDLVKKYALGQKKDLVLQVKLENDDKPVRCLVNFPIQITESDKSIVLVFADGEDAELAKKLGATYVGGEELVQEVKLGNIAFDRCLATKKMFPKVIPIAKILGPKGLMPSPAKGTVSDDVAVMMSSLKASTKLESDADSIIESKIGNSSWSNEDLVDNIRALMKSVVAAKASKVDAGKYLNQIAVYGDNMPGLELPKKPFRSK